jgi:hypothetical protein
MSKTYKHQYVTNRIALRDTVLKSTVAAADANKKVPIQASKLDASLSKLLFLFFLKKKLI